MASTYKILCAIDSSQGASRGPGGGEVRVKTIRKERSWEDKRLRDEEGGGWISAVYSVHLCSFCIETTISPTSIFVPLTKCTNPTIPARAADRWDSFLWLKRGDWMSYTLQWETSAVNCFESSEEVLFPTEGQNAPISIRLTAHFLPLRQENTHYTAYTPAAPRLLPFFFIFCRSTSLSRRR